MSILAHLRRAVVISIIFFIVLGLGYPALEVGIGQAVFGHQANGSLVRDRSQIIGSSLIGQAWAGPEWFQGRPDGYNPMSSGGANLGPRSKKLVAAVAAQVALLKKEGITPTNDLVTTSFSGMDPDISPADAYAQVAAVANARHLSVASVRALVARYRNSAELGFLGAPYIDVLQLNEALAALKS